MFLTTVTTGLEKREFNGPVLLPIWDGEDGTRQGQIAYDDAGTVDPGIGPGLIWWDGVSWHRMSSSTDVPDLQEVTNEGAVTDNSMAVRITGADGPTADMEVSANLGAALVMIRAGRESGEDIAYIEMSGTVAQVAVSTNVDLQILNSTSMVLLTVFADGSGTVDRNGVKRVSGTGSPEGAISAMPGSQYARIDGGPGETFYIKQSGNGTTGWVPLA